MSLAGDLLLQFQPMGQLREKGGNREACCCQAEESILAGAGFSKATTVALVSDKLWALFQVWVQRLSDEYCPQLYTFVSLPLLSNYMCKKKKLNVWNETPLRGNPTTGNGLECLVRGVVFHPVAITCGSHQELKMVLCLQTLSEEERVNQRVCKSGVRVREMVSNTLLLLQLPWGQQHVCVCVCKPEYVYVCALKFQTSYLGHCEMSLVSEKITLFKQRCLG